ncbi:FUSC family protein [Dankookia sp. GCM10030260]
MATVRAVPAAPTAHEAERARQQALRIAVAVAGGMTMMVAAGSITPFLAPLFAAQFLVASRSPLKGAQAFGMAILIISVGQGLDLMTSLLGSRPALFTAMLWLLYLGCFFAQATGKGGQAPFLVLVIAIMVPLMNMLHQDLGESMSVLFGVAVGGGALLAWAAHALFPDPGGMAAAPPISPVPVVFALLRSVANASILVAAVVLCLVDSRLSSAIVIPVTVASILNQLDLATSRRAAFDLVLVNILGGVVASFVFTVVDTRPTLLGLFLAVFVVGLLFGSGAATDPKFGKAYAGALTTFLILLGLGISPLPTSTPESFSTRAC